MQSFADVCFKLITMVLDLCNETTDAYACSTEEDRATMKSSMLWPISICQDVILNTPGFSWDCFEGGDKLVESYYSYQYDLYHDLIVEHVSNDLHFIGAEPYILALQYGRVEDA